MTVATRALSVGLTLILGLAWVPSSALSQISGPTCCTTVSGTMTVTVFKIKVAEAEVNVDSAAAAKVQSAIGDATKVSSQLSDAVAAAFMTASHAVATMVFLRSASAGQFFGGQEDSFTEMVRSGLLPNTAARKIEGDSKTQLAFVNDDGVDKGDKLILTLRGDTVNTRFVTAAGVERANFTRVGRYRRTAFLAEYFAPHSKFRKGIIKSAVESASAARGD